MQESSAYGEKMRQWAAERQFQIDKRKAQEERKDNGSQVWFSRYVHQGRLRHWVLVIEGTKYELKQEKSSNDFIFRVKKQNGWTAELAKRNAALKEKYKPEVSDEHRKKYVCLIGWTHLPPSDLKSIADDIFKQFGTYHLLWNNCQTILQEFSDKILHDRALDYPWFREHTRTEFQQHQQPPRPPTEITMEQLQQQQQQILRETRNQERVHQIQHDIQTQQMIIQLQLQRDIGLNAAQMHLAMNPALTDPSLSAATNPALNPAIMPPPPV
ncbi:MAG: hypothetical protein LQ342_006341 [Letrouitia transgressa]|nr:MAG: hypothetical protein LQ342_006341 [Letrouitia transgressa]